MRGGHETHLTELVVSDTDIGPEFMNFDVDFNHLHKQAELEIFRN